jgi:hypothetical protein
VVNNSRLKVDQQPKHNYKNVRIKHREEIGGTGFGNNFLDITWKAQTTKAKADKRSCVNMKHSVHQRTQSME